MTTLERHVADVCPTCGGNRESRVVFRTGFRMARVPPTCQRRDECEREMLKAAEEAST